MDLDTHCQLQASDSFAVTVTDRPRWGHHEVINVTVIRSTMRQYHR